MLNRPLAAAVMLAAWLALPANLLAGVPPDFTATYKVSRGALTIGTTRIALTREPDGGYHYESHSWPARWAALFNKDKRHETSSGKLVNDRIRPHKYHYLRTGGDRERVAHLTFNWHTRTVVNNVAGSRWKMGIPEGTLDKLSTQLAMMQGLALNRTDFSFDVADGGTLKKFRYRVIGEEILEVPAGSYRTVKVEKLSDNDRRRTLAWCAPRLSFLPVRIWRRETDDTEYTSELENFSDSLLKKHRKSITQWHGLRQASMAE